MTEMFNQLPQSLAPTWEQQIDLLVERELSSEERHGLIQLLDRHPDRWRHCALAFIERDLLRQSLLEIHGRGDPAESVLLGTPAIAARPDPAHGHEGDIDAGDIRGVAKSNVSVRYRIPQVLQNAAPWMVAAALVLTLSVGMRIFRDSLRQSARVPPTAVDSQFETLRSPPMLKTSPEVWLRVHKAVNQLNVADSQVIALVEVARADATTEILPIIQSPTLTQQIAGLPTPQLPRDYVDEIQRAGWQLDSVHQFLSFHFPDGRNQVLPVATHNYRYVGRKVF